MNRLAYFQHISRIRFIFSKQKNVIYQQFTHTNLTKISDIEKGIQNILDTPHTYLLIFILTISALRRRTLQSGIFL